MIEVFPSGNGFRWRFICHNGRTLYEGEDLYPCSTTAARAATLVRRSFWAYACTVDARMGVI